MTRRINSLRNGDVAFEMDDAYRTDDEIEILAEAFATLSKRTRDYIDEITTITAEKERIGTELALATRIQADMLPNIFPAFPERPDFDIYATMTPAKDGVPEATDANKELFGTERMISALNADASTTPEGILKQVRGAVDGFMKEAEQFDDLTMLCLEYKGGAGDGT